MKARAKSVTAFEMSTRARWIALLGCSFITAASAAEPSAQDWIDLQSCTIEMMIARSKDHYVVAVLEHIGKLRCDAGICVETMQIVQLISAHTPDGRLIGSTMEVTRHGVTRAADADPVGRKSLGFYAPDPRGDFYAATSESTPAEPEEVALYEQATKVAVAAATGAPDCLKPFPQLMIGSHEIKSK